MVEDTQTSKYNESISTTEIKLTDRESCTETRCSENGDKFKISCSSCSRWIHYRCTRLPAYHVQNLVKNGAKEFVCINCTFTEQYIIAAMEEKDNTNQTKVNSMVDIDTQTENEELTPSIALDTDKTKNIDSNNIKDGQCKLNILEQKLDKIENILTGKFDLAVKKTSKRTFASVFKFLLRRQGKPKQDSTGAASCPNKTAKW